MARFEFKLPDIGEGVAEGEIVAWHVESGDVVKEDQPKVEVMTDKATVTIGAPKKGTILETHASVGQIMPVGALLVVIDTDGAAAAATPKAAAPAPKAAAKPAPSKSSEGPAATAVGDIKDTLPGAAFFGNKDAAKASEPVAKAAAPASDYYSERPLATPATRKLARDLDVDLRRVRPTGDGNRITHEDVRSFVGGAATKAHVAPAASVGGGVPGVTGRAPIAIHVPAGTMPREGDLETRKPFVGVRRKIAERMQTAKNTAAHFTFVEECDVGRLKQIRNRMKPAAEAAGVKLTFLPFIVRAVVAALKKHPVLNSALDESTNELVTRKYIHMGIAASTDQGLMVPVVKDADRKSILDIAREIDRLGNAAKAGAIASADLAGSTFTLTSLGSQGGLFATPILNHPEVGILGVHQIKKKPVVKDDQIVIGEVMLLSLSFDHRIVDGHVGAAFAYDIIGFLENPESMFLDMV
jgi:pyruvate dehydrogenase E2 component (dihydrolipoamide acetyltransferase)